MLKLGGSLLSLPDLFERLGNLIALLGPHSALIITGGGAAADLIRRLDQQMKLSDEKAHRDAIAAMSYNAAQLTRLSGRFKLVSDRDQAAHVWNAGKTAVLDVDSFLRNEERKGNIQPLPASWDVTSDSIAAWITLRWPAENLIMAKSCDADERSLTQLVANGMVDPWFAQACGVRQNPDGASDGADELSVYPEQAFLGSVSVSWLNLRRVPLTFVPIELSSPIHAGLPQ